MRRVTVSRPAVRTTRARLRAARPSPLAALPDLDRRFEVVAFAPGSTNVLRVTERTSARQCALKFIPLAGMEGWDMWSRLDAEGKALRALSHPGLPRYIEHGECEGGAYLLMSLAPGESLRSRMDRGDRWTEPKLQRILRRTLEVLAYLHELHPPLFHCDVQPEHVLVSDRGEVTLTALGNARSLLTERGQPVAGDGVGVGASGVAVDLVGLGATIAAVASGVDGSKLPRKVGTIDVRACMRGSPVRDAVSLLVAARDEVHCTASQVLGLLRRSDPPIR